MPRRRTVPPRSAQPPPNVSGLRPGPVGKPKDPAGPGGTGPAGHFRSNLNAGEQELSPLGMQRLARSLKSVNQRLLRKVLDDRFDKPSQPQGHVSRQ
jgi:hypothetical protein